MNDQVLAKRKDLKIDLGFCRLFQNLIEIQDSHEIILPVKILPNHGSFICQVTAAEK